MQTLTIQKSKTISSWLLLGLNLHWPVPGSQIVGKTRKKKAREKFRVYAFSIQRTRLSRSLEQAKSARTNVHKPKTVTLVGSLL